VTTAALGHVPWRCMAGAEPQYRQYTGRSTQRVPVVSGGGSPRRSSGGESCMVATAVARASQRGACGRAEDPRVARVEPDAATLRHGGSARPWPPCSWRGKVCRVWMSLDPGAPVVAQMPTYQSFVVLLGGGGALGEEARLAQVQTGPPAAPTEGRQRGPTEGAQGTGLQGTGRVQGTRHNHGNISWCIF